MPAELRWENTCVWDWVREDELPEKGPGWKPSDDAFWYKLTAWHRLREAVEQWGAERGLGRRELLDRGLWPQAPHFQQPREQPWWQAKNASA
jgi:hypothetical protein